MKTCHSFATVIDSTEIHSLWALFISTLAHSLFKVGLGLHMFYPFNKLTRPQFFYVISWAKWEFHFFDSGEFGFGQPIVSLKAFGLNFRRIYYARNGGTPMKILWKMLTDAFRTLVNNLFKEIFYEKKIFYILIIFFISHKSCIKIFLK